MKCITGLLLPLVALQFVACSSSPSPTTPSVTPPANQRWAAYGDSVTEGYTLPDFSQSFVGRLSGTLGPVTHCWIGSSTMQRQVDAIPSCQTDATSVLWLAGYNDMRAGTDLTQLRATLARGLDMFAQQHRTVYLGACLRMPSAGYGKYGPEWNHGSDAAVAALNTMMRDEAARHPSVYFVDFSGYNPETMVGTDFVHPTAAGHAVLADAFLGTILRAQASTN
jgi:lysophospholipase L1-like esterase